eukprot:5651941-Prymnesium_polylepis.1
MHATVPSGTRHLGKRCSDNAATLTWPINACLCRSALAQAESELSTSARRRARGRDGGDFATPCDLLT